MVSQQKGLGEDRLLNFGWTGNQTKQAANQDFIRTDLIRTLEPSKVRPNKVRFNKARRNKVRSIY